MYAATPHTTARKHKTKTTETATMSQTHQLSDALTDSSIGTVIVLTPPEKVAV